MKRLLTLAILCAAFVLSGLTAIAADCYVATNGNNSAAGTNEETAWLTIGHAASNATAGATVYIGAGTFSEFVTNTVSGSSGSPITFQGTRGGSGEWLTIVDPSTLASTGWVAAPEIGSGVYKLTNLTWTVRHMTIDGKRVAFVYDLGPLDPGDIPYDSPPLTNGTDFLTMSATQEVQIASGTTNFLWWESVKALYASDNTNKICYLRLKNGGDPNGMDIRVAPNSETVISTTPGYAAFRVVNKSYLTFRDLCVRGAITGFYLCGSDAHDIIIESNSISCGFAKAVLYSGPHDNIVRDNVLLGYYYGHDTPGAWAYTGEHDTNVMGLYNIYLVGKYIMGSSTSYEYHIRNYLAGNSNTFAGNVSSNGLGSFFSGYGTVTNLCVGTTITNNRVYNQPSCGVVSSEGETEMVVADNMFVNCNSQFRLNHAFATDETNRVVHVFRNRCYLPSVPWPLGDHTFLHVNITDPSTYHPELWIYHNSFSGGRYCWSISADADTAGGTTNTHWINNLISGVKQYAYSSRDYMTNGVLGGTFDWNCVCPSNADYFAGWWGTNNVVSATSEWDTNSVPTFRIASDSSARNAALDVSVPFTVTRGTYSALPDDGTTKIGALYDIGWHEVGSILRATTIRAGTLRGP
jgi:hypothetical protein